MSDEELRAHQQAGRRARTENARKRHGVVPPELVAKTGNVIAALLDAEIEELGEPDMAARAWGVLALAAVYKIRPGQKQKLLDLIREVRPRLAGDPHVERLLDLERARDELVRLYELGEIPRHLLPPEVERLLAPARVAGPPTVVQA